MKKIILLTILAMLVTLLIAFQYCSFFEDEEEEGSDLTVKLYPNPTDPTLFSVTDEEGTLITYIGEKDVQGFPVQIWSVKIQFPDVIGETILFLDSAGYPRQVYASNGTVYQFEWFEGNSFRMNITSPDGSVKLNVPMNLDTLKHSDYNEKGSVLQRTRVKKGQTGLVIERLPASNEQLRATPEIANGTQHVQILRCGEPVDNALVIFEVTPKIGEFSKTILGQPKDGYYSFQVPNTNFPLTDHEAFCAKNAEVVELLCIKQVFEKMDEEGSLCVNLSHMIIGIENDPQVQKIIQACKEVAEAIKVTCSIIASDPDLCKKVLVAEYGTPQAVEYTFHLQVSIPGEGTEYSDATTFDPTIPAVFTYIMEPKLSVDLRMYPPDPAPDQSYLASAKILCPDPEGTPVTISVSGSDGYADSNSDVITYNTTISLYIPGAEEGVTDVITLVIGDKSWTQVITF